MLLHVQLWYFFPHIICQRQLQLIRYDIALWDISLYLVE